MVVFFESEGGSLRNILAVEHDVMSPTIPADYEIQDQIIYYNGIGMKFISLPYEMGGKIFNYKVCINEKEEFIGLQPITK